jgi:hypothetical protein
MRAARAIAMATATKRAMATDGDNMGNGYGDEVSRQATAVTMAMRMGTVQRTSTHPTTGERGMMVAMGHGLCVSLCVCGETTKNKVGPKKSQCVLELVTHQGLGIDKPH